METFGPKTFFDRGGNEAPIKGRKVGRLVWEQSLGTSAATIWPSGKRWTGLSASPRTTPARGSLQASPMTQEFRDKRPPPPDPLLERRRGNPITSHVAEFSCRRTSNNGDDNEQFDQRKSLSPRLGFRERVSGSVFASRFHFLASMILSAAKSSSKAGAFHRRTAPSAALTRRLPLGEKATTERVRHAHEA